MIVPRPPQPLRSTGTGCERAAADDADEDYGEAAAAASTALRFARIQFRSSEDPLLLYP